MSSPDLPFRGRLLGIVLSAALLGAAGAASAAVPIQAASLKRVEGRTRLVIDSPARLRFSLLILRYPDRVVLELEDVLPGAMLASLAGQIEADHPYMEPVRIAAPAAAGGSIRIEFRLKDEAQPSIRAYHPAEGRGYSLVLDFVPPGAEPSTAPSPLPAPPPSARVPSPPGPAPAPAPLPSPPVPIAVPVPAPQQETRPVDAMPKASPFPAEVRPPSAPQKSRQPLAADDPDLILLELRLDERVLDPSLSAYQRGRETFLPLGELARLLSLAIRTQPAQGTAEGFVLSEARAFRLNLPQSRLQSGDQTHAFDPAQVLQLADDIYVESQLLSRWLPVDFVVDFSSLTLRARSRERLPLQERWERERLGGKAIVDTTAAPDPGYPRQDIPYRLLGTPFIDQRLGLGLKAGNGSRETSAEYTAYLTGDLLGMESAVYVSSTSHAPSPDVRFTLARHDPDAGLLGLARARSVMFGSGVSMPSVSNVTHRSPTGDGYGLMLSNRPLTQPANFDRHTLQGDLPPGWDVELYFNEALVGFQTSRPDGRYSFDDLPLTYGPNEFRLVFHGPLGQQRVERQSFLLEQSSTPPGAFYYNLVQHQDGGQARSLAQFEWGLSKNLTGTAGFTRLPAALGSADPAARTYSNLGLRAFWGSYIFSTDFVRGANGGWLNESGLKTRLAGIAMSYSHTHLSGFNSDVFAESGDGLRTRDKLRLDGTIPATVLPRMPVMLEVQREQFSSHRSNLAVTGRISAYVNRTAIANQLTWLSADGDTSAAGVLHLSRRFGDLGLSGQLGYSLLPSAEVETLAVAADKRLGGGYQFNLGLIRTMASGETAVTASLNKGLGNYGLGLSTSYSSHGTFALGVQLFMAMGREPRQGTWRFDAQPKADGGTASARVFLDNNANGLLDGGEEPIENVALVVNGSRAPMRTDAAGVAWLDRLPIRQHVDIHIDPQTLEDPYWAPLRKGVRVVPRPGQAAELDFPVVLTSEIDGTVYLFEQSSKRGVGDVLIELLDMERKVLSTIKTGPDGYYIVPALLQGRYYLRISPRQVRQFGLIDPGMREVVIRPDGKFVNGVDFVLIKDTPSDVSASRR